MSIDVGGESLERDSLAFESITPSCQRIVAALVKRQTAWTGGALQARREVAVVASNLTSPLLRAPRDPGSISVTMPVAICRRPAPA